MDMHNTSVHLSSKPTINGKRFSPERKIALAPMGDLTRVTMTLHVNELDIDWNDLHPSVEIIAADDIFAEKSDDAGGNRIVTRKNIENFIENWRMTIEDREEVVPAEYILDNLEKYISNEIR